MEDDLEQRILRLMTDNVDKYEKICRSCDLFKTKECCGCPAVQEEPYLQLERCKHGYWDKKLTDVPKRQVMNKLTIGMAVYDDYDGVYFSLQALRMSPYRNLIHEIIVIDNNPDSAQGKAVATLVTSKLGGRTKYIPYTEKRSTSIRSKIFEEATGDYVLVMDCHVLIDPFSAPMMQQFLMQPVSKNLFHGMLLTDALTDLATEMTETWNEKFYGQWHYRPGTKATTEPFEIRLQGLGLFMAHRLSWLGFNPLFRGFGGEEGYIHEKYRTHGRKVMCLPWLKWLHRFERPTGIPYRNDDADRIFNYTVGWTEVGLDLDAMRLHFEKFYPKPLVRQIINDGLVASGKLPKQFD